MTNRERVKLLRKNNPTYTQEQIAKICHITKERVGQLLKAEGMPTRAKLPIRTQKGLQDQIIQSFRHRINYFRH